MRRINAIAIMIAFFGLGGVAFLLLRVYGFDVINAGVWSQVALVVVLLGWISTYVFRAVTQTMTYNQQLDDYKKAVLTKQLEEMTPEAREKLFAEVAAENNSSENSPKNVVTNTKDE